MRWLRRLNEKVFFSNLNPVLNLGAKRSLQPADLPALPPHLDPEIAVIAEDRVNWSTGGKMLISLLVLSRKYWMAALGFYLVFGAMNLLGPVLVNLFVKNISGGFVSPAALRNGLLYGAGVGIVGVVGGLALQHYFVRHLAWSQIITNVVNKRVFTHALALQKEARDATPVGDIVNHMSADTDSVAEFGGAIGDLIYSVLMILGALSLLFYYIGDTAWVAVVLLLTLAPITKKVSRDFTRFDEDLMKWRDQRVTLMSQILSAIRLVKHFVWETSVAQEVAKVRAHELRSRGRIARAQLMVTLLYVSVGTVVLFSVLAVHTWRGGTLDAALVFTCVSLFALLEDPFAHISRVVSMIIGAKVGGDRIARFLSLKTVSPRPVSGVNSVTAAGFKMRNFRVRYEAAREAALVDIDLAVKAGSSLAVVGGVGSGKSTFIHALLGEVRTEAGDLRFTTLDGESLERVRIGFVPQEAYILNGTLRENLTFGRMNVSDPEIMEALGLSCLAADVTQMTGGLDTEIGEKGINLSGGQRQRLSLARAVLHQPQMVILDDPLSAVDSNTEAQLAQNLLFGRWSGTTRIMITHRLSGLERFDQIAFLEKGRLLGVGRFEMLAETCKEFRAYMAEYGRSHSSHGVEIQTAADSVQAKGEAIRVTEDEDRNFGAVRGGMYWDYILSLGGENQRLRPVILLLLLTAAASATFLPLLQKGWLAYMSNVQGGNGEGLDFLRGLAAHPMSAIYIYGLIGLFVLGGTLAADLFWLRRGLAAGRSIHDGMLKGVLGTSVRFFDATPVGRALQRFSRDMEAIDIHLQWSFEHSVKCFAQVAITLLLIAALLPSVIVFLIPVFYVYYRMQKLYRASAREVKRLDSISRSPRYAHFKETLQGLTVIRAYGKADWFLGEFYGRLRHNQRMFFGHYMINRWFSSRIPVIGGMVAMATTVGIVFAVRKGHLSPGEAGLLTVYSLSFWGVLNWGIRVWAEVEARMTSMERVRHFMNLPAETETLKKVDLPLSWPSQGAVQFEDVRLRYAGHMPLVLKGLSFEIKPGTRVGIIGRTGSGKSTIFQALYRFIELEEGRILIDDVDIAGVPLPRLRKALAIIPQDPTLFIGTLRSNLDRYDEHDDEALWTVLDRTSLGEFVRGLPQGLHTELVENGVNLSQGQRQLLCLARALLISAKVIILDEATASVDVKTDATVQKVLRESCKGVTMLIIAHRLGTVRDCDQILEIAEGQLRRRIEPKVASALGESTPARFPQ